MCIWGKLRGTYKQSSQNSSHLQFTSLFAILRDRQMAFEICLLFYNHFPLGGHFYRVVHFVLALYSKSSWVTQAYMLLLHRHIYRWRSVTKKCGLTPFFQRVTALELRAVAWQRLWLEGEWRPHFGCAEKAEFPGFVGCGEGEGIGHVLWDS